MNMMNTCFQRNMERHIWTDGVKKAEPGKARKQWLQWCKWKKQPSQNKWKWMFKITKNKQCPKEDTREDTSLHFSAEGGGPKYETLLTFSSFFDWLVLLNSFSLSCKNIPCYIKWLSMSDQRERDTGRNLDDVKINVINKSSLKKYEFFTGRHSLSAFLCFPKAQHCA